MPFECYGTLPGKPDTREKEFAAQLINLSMRRFPLFRRIGHKKWQEALRPHSQSQLTQEKQRITEGCSATGTKVAANLAAPVVAELKP